MTGGVGVGVGAPLVQSGISRKRTGEDLDIQSQSNDRRILCGHSGSDVRVKIRSTLMSTSRNFEVRPTYSQGFLQTLKV